MGKAWPSFESSQGTVSEVELFFVPQVPTSLMLYSVVKRCVVIPWIVTAGDMIFLLSLQCYCSLPLFMIFFLFSMTRTEARYL